MLQKSPEGRNGGFSSFITYHTLLYVLCALYGILIHIIYWGKKERKKIKIKKEKNKNKKKIKNKNLYTYKISPNKN